MLLVMATAGVRAQDAKTIAGSGIEIDLSFVECSLPANGDSLAEQSPSSDDIERLPEQSKKLLARVTAAGAPGKQLEVDHVNNPAQGAKAAAMAFAPGESGTKASITFFEGASALGANIILHFRKQSDEQDDKITTDIDFATVFESYQGAPLVIHVCSVPNREGRFICVIARLRKIATGDAKDAGGNSAGNAISSPKK